MKIDPGFSEFPLALLSPSGPELTRVWQHIEREYDLPFGHDLWEAKWEHEKWLNRHDGIASVSGPTSHRVGDVPQRPWAKPMTAIRAMAKPNVPRETEDVSYEEWLAHNTWSSGCGGTKWSDLP